MLVGQLFDDVAWDEALELPLQMFELRFGIGEQAIQLSNVA